MLSSIATAERPHAFVDQDVAGRCNDPGDPGAVVDGARGLPRADVVQAVGRSYAGAQAFAGPVLVVPYTETVEVQVKDPDGVARKQTRQVERQWALFPTSFAGCG